MPFSRVWENGFAAGSIVSSLRRSTKQNHAPSGVNGASPHGSGVRASAGASTY
jgi:hypothetical protein